MKDKRLQLIAGLASLCFAEQALGGNETLIEQSFARAWRKASTVEYVAPGRDDIDKMRSLFIRMLKNERSDGIKAELKTLGWALRVQTTGTVTWTVVAEADTQRSGRGLYAFASQGTHALQAPHVPTDGMTGEILLRYASDALPRALAWNTVPRAKADLAHLDDTYLLAFSLAYADVYPNEKIIQFHGFDSSRRRTRSAAESEAIISAGHKRPSRGLRTAAQCLKKRFDPNTRLYGDDVDELGGTTNTTAQALHRQGYDNFVHVELSKPLRQMLTDDADKRRSLLDCLGGRT